MTNAPLYGWDDVDAEEGFYWIDLGPQMVDGLIKFGADINDPQSIEDILMARIKRTTGMLS